MHCANLLAAGLNISIINVHVRNLIGTECSLIEVSIGLRRKQAKINSIDRFRNTEVFPIDLDFGL